MARLLMILVVLCLVIYVVASVTLPAAQSIRRTAACIDIAAQGQELPAECRRASPSSR
ncbi:hypothetical protein PaMx28_42 [Pseudomonas phage PaMx28]|uniref:Uncharacterized protein n=1 Tax=Pseudomonas phage PaMx28 TaxID=1175659 RepID=A0A0S0MWZ5_9CAUD|nr:hypothetical protein AVV51_gp42 [Pseudomonas phage PaMx28]ALH23642.1 hypothetical protein PaMx28_42 [Pseudomonas phage PaMx28]